MTSTPQQELDLKLPLDPPVFVDGMKTYNIAALVSFVLSAVRGCGRSVVTAQLAGATPEADSPSDAPQNDYGKRLLLNAYGRQCYNEGRASLRAQIEQLKRRTGTQRGEAYDTAIADVLALLDATASLDSTAPLRAQMRQLADNQEKVGRDYANDFGKGLIQAAQNLRELLDATETR